MKVLPYEHRGNMLSKMIVRSSDDILWLAEEFSEEKDKWIRKIIAQKLLDQEIEVLPEGLVSSLREATHHKLV